MKKTVVLFVALLLLIPTFAVASSHLDAQVADNTARIEALEAAVYGEAPTASFSYAPASPEVDQEVTFDGVGSTGADSYDWDIDGVGAGTGTTLAHTFTSSGDYTVTLTVTDTHGRTATDAQTVTVSAAPVPAPTASFSYAPTSPEVDEEVTFDGSSSTGASSYAWDIDGTAAGTGATLAHTFTSADDYTVALTVTGTDGQTATDTQTVTVAAAPPPPPTSHPADCAGYPEPRTLYEAQSWWQPHPEFGGTEDNGHVHAATCFPRTHHPDGSVNKISGDIDLDLKVMMHNNPGVLDFVRVQIADPSGTRNVANVTINETCVVGGPRWDTAAAACVWNVPVTVDTTMAGRDGFQEFRVTAAVDFANGDEMFNSSGWQAYLENGKSVDHYRKTGSAPREFIEGRGWYTGADYTVGRFADRLPYEVSGTWSPRLVVTEGAGGVDVGWSFISINPNFHHGNQGTVLVNQAGTYNADTPIDTTSLNNGWHRLFIRGDAPCDGTSGNNCGTKGDGSSNNTATNSGIQIIWFKVAN